MSKKIKKIFSGIVYLGKKGLFYILFGEVFAKIIKFISSIIIVRFTSKIEYGIWTYSNNLLSLMLLFDGLGIASGVLQFSSKCKCNKYYRFGIKFGSIVNSVISSFVLFVGIFSPLKIPEARPFLITLAFLPIPRVIYSVRLQFIRAQKQANLYGKVVSLYVLVYIFAVTLLIPIIKIWGALLAEYLAVFCSLAYTGVLNLKKLQLSNQETSQTLERFERVSIIKFSITASLSNAVSQLLYLIDTFLIGLLIADATVLSSYKVATLIPYNLTFIPLAFVSFVYPYFAGNSDNFNWIVEKTKKFILYMVLLNALITIFLILFGSKIILITFGEKYSDSVQLFRLLMIGYFIAASIRIPLGNIIASLGEVKINLVNSILSGIVNTILDTILINKLGSLGAALATVTVFIISSAFSVLAFYKIYNSRKMHNNTR